MAERFTDDYASTNNPGYRVGDKDDRSSDGYGFAHGLVVFLFWLATMVMSATGGFIFAHQDGLTGLGSAGQGILNSISSHVEQLQANH